MQENKWFYWKNHYGEIFGLEDYGGSLRKLREEKIKAVCIDLSKVLHLIVNNLQVKTKETKC